MPNIMIGKIAVDIPDAGTAKIIMDEIEAKQTKIDSLNTEAEALRGTADALKVKLDEATNGAGQGNGGNGKGGNENKGSGPCSGLEGAELDECKKKQQAKTDEAIAKEVELRMDTLSKVKKFVPNAKVDSTMDALQMKTVALKETGSKTLKLDDASDAYINAAFDIMVQQKMDDKAGNFNEGSSNPKNDNEDPRSKFMAKMRG